MPQPSTLSPPRHKIQHNWNDWPYFVELLGCIGSDDQKWFVKTAAERILVCDQDQPAFKSVWLYHPFVELGFDTAQEALAAFDTTMAARYANIVYHL